MIFLKAKDRKDTRAVQMTGTIVVPLNDEHQSRAVVDMPQRSGQTCSKKKVQVTLFMGLVKTTLLCYTPLKSILMV